MPAKWTRVSLTAMPPGETLQRGGMMLMATSAKKHLTIFRRSRTAKGAGRPEVKKAFTIAAGETGGTPLREDRNLVIKEAIEKAGLKTGIYHKKSRSKYSPLSGRVYELKYAKTLHAEIGARIAHKECHDVDSCLKVILK